MSKACILLIEDDPQMQRLIVDYLENFDYCIEAFDDPMDVLSIFPSSKERYDLVILDLMLPNMDGFEIGKRIKKQADIPIIISSARGDIGNKILGFEIGADDYLAKPYEPRELVLRVEALLRRHHKNPVLRYGDFYLDETTREVKVDDYPVELTKVEFDLLLYFLRHPGKVLSREQLIGAVGLPPDTRHRTVDMHISNLRYKIGDDPKKPRYIKSVWGIGYKLIEQR